MSRARRKKQIRNRIIAFVMAVAMVFTVVKVNSGKSIVKAGGGQATGVEDENYLSNILLDSGNKLKEDLNSDIKIHTQNSGVKFKLPGAIAPVETESTYYVDDAGSVTVEETGNSFTLKITDTYAFDSDETLCDTVPKHYLVMTREIGLVTKNGSVSDEVVQIQKDALLDGFEDDSGRYIKKILELNYVLSDDAYSISNGGITENWSNTSSDGNYYYGTNRYAVLEKGEGEGLYADKSSINIENLTYNQFIRSSEVNLTKGKTYYIVHRYLTEKEVELSEGEKELVYFTTSDIKELTFGAPEIHAIIINPYATGDKNIMGTKEIIYAGVDGNNSVEELVIKTLFYSAESPFSNSETGYTASVVLQKKNNEGGYEKVDDLSGISIDEEPHSEYSFSTDAELKPQEGTATYRIMISTPNFTEYSDDFTVCFDKTAPVIGKVSIQQEGIGEDEPFKRDKDITVGFTVTDEISSVDETTLKIVFNGEEYNATESESNYSCVIKSDKLSGIEGGVPQILKIDVKDVAGNAAITKEMELVFADETKPVINGVIFKQGETEYAESNPLNANDDIKVNLDITEDGSGVDPESFTFKLFKGDSTEAEISKDHISGTLGEDGKYTFSLSKTDLEITKDGRERTYNITVSDKSGNVSEVKSGTLKFADGTPPGIKMIIKQGEQTYIPEKADSELETDERNTLDGSNEGLIVINIEVADELNNINNDSIELKIPDLEAGTDYSYEAFTSDSKKIEATYKLTDSGKEKIKDGKTRRLVFTVEDDLGNEGKIEEDLRFEDKLPPTITIVEVIQNGNVMSEANKLSVNDSFDIVFSVVDEGSGVKENSYELQIVGVGQKHFVDTFKYLNSFEDKGNGQYLVHLSIGADQMLGQDCLDKALRDGEIDYTIIASDNKGNKKQIDAGTPGKLYFKDEVGPEITEEKVLQDQDLIEGLEEITGKLTSKKDFTVKFMATDIGRGIDDTEVKVELSSGTGEEKQLIVEAKLATPEATGEENTKTGYYQVDFTAEDLKNVSPNTEYTLTIYAKDNEGNSVDKTKTVQFFDEAAEITIEPSFKDNLKDVDGNSYADYTSVTHDEEFYYTITVKSEVPLKTDESTTYAIEKTSDCFNEVNFVLEGSSVDTPVDGKFVYVFKTDKISTATGKYSLNIAVTNKFDSKTEKESPAIYYIDINNPEANLGGFIDELGTTSADANKFYTKVYVIVSGIKETELAGQSGLDIDSVKITGLTEVKAPSKNESGEYTVIYTVNESQEPTGTPVSFSIKDKVGNEKSITDNFCVDATAPKVTDDSFKVDNETVGTSAFNKTKDVPVSLNITDNVHIDRIVFKCTSAPSGISPVSEGYVVQPSKPTKSSSQSVLLGKIVSGSETPTDLKEGSYTVSVIAYDLSGNKTEEKKATIIIDKTAPLVDISVQSGLSEPKTTGIRDKNTYRNERSDSYQPNYEYYKYARNNVTLKFTVRDDNVVENNIVVKNGDENLDIDWSLSSRVWTGTYTFKDEGTYSVTIAATDNAGIPATVKSGQTVRFTIDKNAPSTNVTLNGTEKTKNTKEEHYIYNGAVQVNCPELKDSEGNLDKTDVTLVGTFTPAGSSVSQNIEQKVNFGGANPLDISFSKDGEYMITYVAVDYAGNRFTTDPIYFQIDTANPELDLKITNSTPAKFGKFKNTYKPAVEGYFTTAANGYDYGQYYKEDVKITVSVFDYDADSFKVTDNGEELDAEFKDKGNGLYTADITLTGEGSHTIKAFAVDKSGNEGESSTVSFIIDKTAPKLTTTLDAETYSGMDAFKAKDAVIGIAVEDANKDADDIKRVSVTELSDGSDTITAEDYVKEGQETYKKNAYYTVTYTVVDKAGNTSTAKIGFTIDTTKPQSDIRITTKAPAKINKFSNQYSNTNGHFNTTYTYGQYYNESVAMGMVVFDYNTDSIVVTDNDEVIPVTLSKKGDEIEISSITISGEGEHVVKITVTDKSGNDASNTVGFTIDTTAPSLSATLNGSGNITDQYLPTDASVYLSVSDTNEDEDDVTRVVKLTRPSASAENTTETGALEGTIGYSTEADYEITYTAIDRAGNESSPVTYTFRVDKTAPQLSITGITRDATSPENVTITYSMIEDFYWDVNSAEVKIYKKVDGAGESLLKTVDFKASGANSSMSDLFEEDGEYRFEFTAEDKTGNQANENFRFILDKNAPIITLSGVDGYLTDEDVTFGVKVDETFYLGNNVKLEGTRKTIDEPDGKPIEFDDYTKLTRSSSASFEQIFTEDGIYNIKVTSKDAAGNETVQNVQFTIDKTDPLIKDLEELADEEDYEIYQAAVSSGDTDAKKALIPIFNEFNFDYDADDIVTDLTTVTYKLYMDGVLYDGLSEVADGFHELRITAEDEVGNTAERTFYFILDTVKPGIIVTGVEEGDNLMDPTTITVSLQLTEDTLKSVKLNGNPVAISGNTASFEVSEKGDYELVIEAVDDAGNESTMTIKFEYGRTSSWLWWLIGGGAALIIAAAIFFIILGKKRKKDE